MKINSISELNASAIKSMVKGGVKKCRGRVLLEGIIYKHERGRKDV